MPMARHPSGHIGLLTALAPPIVTTRNPLSSVNPTRGGARIEAQGERPSLPPQLRLASLRQDSLSSRRTRTKTAASHGLVDAPAKWTLGLPGAGRQIETPEAMPVPAGRDESRQPS